MQQQQLMMMIMIMIMTMLMMIKIMMRMMRLSRLISVSLQCRHFQVMLLPALVATEAAAAAGIRKTSAAAAAAAAGAAAAEGPPSRPRKEISCGGAGESNKRQRDAEGGQGEETPSSDEGLEETSKMKRQNIQLRRRERDKQ